MTRSTEIIFDRYQIRKTKKQKSAFIEYVKSFAQEKGYRVKVEKGFFGVRNIVIGDIDKAKVVYTAHYDTCPVLPFPNILTPKSFGTYLLYNLLISLILFIVIFAFSFLLGMTMGTISRLLGNTEISATAVLLVYYVFLFGLLYLMLAGPANKHTANDNTSGVTTLIDIMNELPPENRDKVAFVFFDLEEMGLLGSSAFASKHKKVMKNKLLVNFDCVSDGEYVLLAVRKGAKEYLPQLQAAFCADKVEILTKGAFCPSDQMSFPCGVGVAAFKKSKKRGILYVDRIHTSKDTVYREENIELLKNCALKLAEIN